MIRGSSDRSVLVLTSLSSGPRHGRHALIKDIETFSGVSSGPGSLYGAIAKLEEAGLIEPMPGEGRRKPYRITGKGAADLRAQLEQSHADFEGRARSARRSRWSGVTPLVRLAACRCTQPWWRRRYGDETDDLVEQMLAEPHAKRWGASF